MILGTGKSKTLSLQKKMPQARLGSLLVWVGAGFSLLSMAVVVWSLQQANWVTPQPSLFVTLGLATAEGVILAKSRLPGKVAVPIIVITGLGVTVWQAVLLFTPNGEITSLQLWWQTVSSSRPNGSSVYFTMFLTFIVWAVGVISSWSILRKQNAWPAVFLGTVVLLVNLSNLPRGTYHFSALFSLTSILTLATVSLAKQGGAFIRWEQKAVRHSLAHFSTAVLSLAVVSVSVAYFMPTPNLSGLSLNIDKSVLWESNVEGLWFNIFADVTSKWMRIESNAQENLLFRDPIETGNQIIFLVNAEDSNYWRTRRYDIYAPWGWSSSVRSKQGFSPGEPIIYAESTPNTRTLTYTVESRLETDVFISSGEVVSANIPVEVQFFSPGNGGEKQSLIGKRNVAAIVSRQVITPYQLYRVVTGLTQVTVAELAAVGKEYPEWVTAHYLQLPDSLPGRVRKLSEDITRDARTSYDKAIAVKSYLSTFSYNLSVEAFPEGTDGVDYLLFTAREGDCRNFASAMAVMLRSLGIPARISTGYFRGELDKTSGDYALRGRNYHAWVEVYFPKYGWIEFEASPFSPQIAATVPGEGIIQEGEYNLSFSGGEELPPWMIEEEHGTFGNVQTGRSQSAGQTSRWTHVYYLRASILTIIVLAISAFIVRKSFGLWVERLKQVDTVAEAYDRMCYLAKRGNYGPFAHETPLEFSRRISQHLPEQADAIKGITQAYLHFKYSPAKQLDDSGQTSLEKDWVRLCTSLVKRMLRQGKWAPIRFLWSSG